jgi:hypothetical protein
MSNIKENFIQNFNQTDSLNINNLNNNKNNISNFTHQIKNLSKIRNILDLPKLNRTKENINFLYENFKDLSFFRLGIINYGEKTINDILESCHLLELNKNSVILNSRENAKSSYILLSGEILISTKEAIFEINTKIKNVKRKISTEKSYTYKAIDSLGNQSGELFNNRKSTNFFEENNNNYNDNNNEGFIGLKLKNTDKFMSENWYVKIGDIFGDKSLLERKTR